MNNKKISILGFSTDENSSFLKGCAGAPPIIMKAFESNATNKFSENGIDLGMENLWTYQSFSKIPSSKEGFQLIRDAVYKELKTGRQCISIGGDHSISYPIIDAYNHYFENINILHFDAHPDLYDNFENNPFSHASPFARILENDLSKKLIQIGIRTMNHHQQEQANKYKVQVIDMKNFRSNLKLDFNGPVYISIDLDGLDPSFAPGVSHPEPGGLSTRDVLSIVSGVKGDVIGADIVEYNPKKDLNNITAITAAKFLKELSSKLLS